MGLRFFIWAGIQPSYRHSSNMYAKACKLLEIDQNPQSVKDVIESCRIENCSVTVKMFKLVLNLCTEAKDENLGFWVPDTTAYNVVIRLFSQEGKMDEARGLMREMDLIDLYLDMITYISVINGLCDVGRLEDACGLIKTMKGHGFLPNAIVYSAILDGIGKSGRLENSLDMLAEMEKESGSCKPNVVTYTSVIQNFCEKGRSVEALTILGRMKSFGCIPNRITMSILIKGLCKDGYIEEAHRVIDEVAEDSMLRWFFRRMFASGLRPDGFASSTLIRWLCLEGRYLDAKHKYTIDSDIYSILLAGLCQDNHLVEAAKVASLILKRGVQLNSSYKDNVSPEYWHGIEHFHGLEGTDCFT
ncbi:hypothetical protein M9H77_31516 [Catharanthus roseus]|uniref:Uncharacterized protein n=1 Tax=Catharanthus roseus TaxID=4058 RepID=A0ACC0A2D3_CATRO|nr:hypothetical protein M9H77_31516 [Catharanthus roseus]